MNTGANQGTGFKYGSGWGDRLNGGSKPMPVLPEVLNLKFHTQAYRHIKAYANGTTASTKTGVPSNLLTASSNNLTLARTKDMENFSSSETPLAILIGKP